MVEKLWKYRQLCDLLWAEVPVEDIWDFGKDEYRISNKECRMTKGKSEFDLEDRLIDFAVRIIRTAESLPKSKVGKHIAGQLIRSCIG